MGNNESLRRIKEAEKPSPKQVSTNGERAGKAAPAPKKTPAPKKSSNTEKYEKRAC